MSHCLQKLVARRIRTAVKSLCLHALARGASLARGDREEGLMPRDYDWLAPLIDETAPDLRGASPAALARLEETLDVKLAPSHRAFLARWNGLPRFFGRTLNILSAEEIVAWHEEREPFRPWSGEPAFGHRDDYYEGRPLHYLTFVQVPHGDDVRCFDTRPASGGEYPVRWFDGDPTDGVFVAPSFEAYLMREVMESLAMEEVHPEVRATLLTLLGARGVTEAGTCDVDWTGYQEPAGGWAAPPS
jgi:hypothetical protein